MLVSRRVALRAALLNQLPVEQVVEERREATRLETTDSPGTPEGPWALTRDLPASEG